MSEPNYSKTKRTCYYSYLAMSSVFTLPPLLFMTFREMYNISYTLLGTLVLINFCTQFIVDIIFTLFSKHFNIKHTVRLMPLLTSLGLCIYAIFPMLFPEHAYIGLAIGTVIFSVAAGLAEVLVSPLVAAIPSENPERDMSMLHSLYAWGVVVVVLISTIFIKIFGAHNWMYLTLFLACFPLAASAMYFMSPIPDMDVSSHSADSSASKNRFVSLAMCTCCIFIGAAAENVMTNWVSGYIESTLGIPKMYGDIFGMALFAVLLGFGRVLYARIGKNISRVLLLGMIGSVVCYLTAALSNNVYIALFACVMVGFSTSMLWPGTLIFMEENIPSADVAAYALMAAGGDFGSSIAPQLMGIIVDNVAASSFAQNLSAALMISPEQIGMKTGMLITAAFPALGIILVLAMKKYFSSKKI